LKIQRIVINLYGDPCNFLKKPCDSCYVTKLRGYKNNYPNICHLRLSK